MELDQNVLTRTEAFAVATVWQKVHHSIGDMERAFKMEAPADRLPIIRRRPWRFLDQYDNLVDTLIVPRPPMRLPAKTFHRVPEAVARCLSCMAQYFDKATAAERVLVAPARDSLTPELEEAAAAFIRRYLRVTGDMKPAENVFWNCLMIAVQWPEHWEERANRRRIPSE